MAAQYNNELSPHVLSSLTNTLFSEADYASLDVEMMMVLKDQEEYEPSCDANMATGHYVQPDASWRNSVGCQLRGTGDGQQ